MDFFSAEFFSALLAIIIIDLVLAGDNAVVIGMAARNLPKDKQKPVIIWGTLGAIIIRALATIAVVWLLEIPGLLLVGGLVLVWISYKLLVDKKDHGEIDMQSGLLKAIMTIIVADTVMGVDNVLAIAGAAHGNFVLVIIGLLISVPIMVYGSRFIIVLMDRFPAIIYIGAGVLAWTAGKMITDEPIIKGYLAAPYVKWPIIILVVAGVLLVGKLKNRAQPQEQDELKQNAEANAN
jgi:YjbE family integral membrane protein